MTRRTRRRLTTGAAVLAAGATYAWTDNEYAAAILAAVVLVLGLLRPPKPRRRRRSPRHRAPRVPRTTPNLDLEYRRHARYHGWNHTHTLAYVGIVALSPDRSVEDRIDEHLENEPEIWAAVSYVTVAGYHPTRTEALAAEAHDIHVLNPPLNRTHKTHPIHMCSTIATARARGYLIPAPTLQAAPPGVGP